MSGKGFVAIGDELAYSVQEILGEYGITYAGSYGNYGSSSNFDHSHPIMTDVNYIYASYPVNSLHAVPPAYWIANDAFNVQMLIAGAEVNGYVLCLSDDFAADVYYDDNEIMFANMVEWIAVKYEHDLAVSLEAPVLLEPDASILLNATVRNYGLNNETSVELHLMINGTIVNSTVTPELLTRESYTLSHLWTPVAEGIYNVTAYAPPVLDEGTTANNVKTKIVSVKPIKYVLFDQTHGTDSITSYSTWIKSLAERGYMVETNIIEPITPTVLEDYDVFISAQAHSSYTANEFLAIQNFVSNGGGLLVIGDDYPWIYTDLTSFAGITWAAGGASGITTDITPHPVTNGVMFVYLDAPVAIMNATGVAQDIVRDPTGNIMLVVSEQPSGKVIGFADEGSLWNYAIDQADNLRLANNMIDWLAIPIRYEHDLAVTLIAPTFLEPGNSLLFNATVLNRGLSNETGVELFLLIDGTAANSATISELLTGASYTIRYLWTPTVEATYNVTAYSPLVFGENVTANNAVSKMVRVCHVTVALISDNSELLVIMPILDSVGIRYDIYNDNSIHLYTEDPNLLLEYSVVIFSKYNRVITLNEHSALQSYLSSGGNLLVTGYDSLGHPDDWLLADIVRSCSAGDNVGEPNLYVVNGTHPIMNGPYGSFPAGFNISGLYEDCDAAEADTMRYAITVAELRDGCDKIIATELSPGSVVYWNGFGADDWTTNADCEAMLKNTLAWFATLLIQRKFDAAIIGVTASATWAYEGQMVNINVTAKNQGNTTETFDVTAYYNTSVIGTQVVISLPAGANVTLTFRWNTGDVPLYISHTIWAKASIAPSETNTDNNVCVDGTIMIEMMGDVSGDKKVDGKDIAIIALAFGSYPDHHRWNIRSDLYRDGRIDGRDMALAAKNFGKTYP
jgi:hypothetical protein